MKNRFRIVLGLFLVLGFGACAPNLAGSWKPGLQGSETPTTPRVSVRLHSSAPASAKELDGLRAGLVRAIDSTGCFPPDGRTTFAFSLTPRMEQTLAWPWYLGLVTVVWPALPRTGSLSLDLEMKILVGGKLSRKLTLTEAEDFDLFWYGLYRVAPLQEKMDFLYQKTFASLGSLLSSQVCPVLWIEVGAE